MFRYKVIRNLLFLSLAVAVLFPAYDFVFVHPSYDDLLTEKTENEAVRYASYMVRTLGLEGQVLSSTTLPKNLAENIKPVSRDQQLYKLRIFSSDGVIIFSTKEDEVGSVNQRDYFINQVAKGQVYSKVVKKNRSTAEGLSVDVDIVETYVPFMVNNVFGGAFEVYYDITETVKKAHNLSFLSRAASVFMSLAFLIAISVALNKAFVSFQERDAADEALRNVNDSLENKVTQRTRELVDANELLTEQIAERINAQNALADALDEIRVDREKINEILRSVPDGVVVADADLKILHVNATAEEILNVSLDDVKGSPLKNLIDNDELNAKVAQQFNSEYPMRAFDVEFSGHDADVTFVYQARIKQFAVGEYHTPGLILVLRDVTREREVERMKSSFLGMAAHELNTPLTTIIGYTELLVAEETHAQIGAQQHEEYLQLIHEKALDLGRLIDDLLDVSRVESGRPLFIDYQDFDLIEGIKAVVDRFCTGDVEHEFELLLPNEPIVINAGKDRLTQVVDHLVSNAVKYSPGGGTVTVKVQDADSHVNLSVADDGIGMAKEQLDHIFDRFYRADSTDTAVQGAGLGMSIVKHIVLAHQGEITVNSQPGNGTQVLVSIPKSSSGQSEVFHPFNS